MKRLLLTAAFAAFSLCLSAAGIDRVEPLSWWTGMKTPLQIMVNGEGVGAYDAVSVEGGKGLKSRPYTKPTVPITFLWI